MAGRATQLERIKQKDSSCEGGEAKRRRGPRTVHRLGQKREPCDEHKRKTIGEKREKGTGIQSM